MSKRLTPPLQLRKASQPSTKVWLMARRTSLRKLCGSRFAHSRCSSTPLASVSTKSRKCLTLSCTWCDTDCSVMNTLSASLLCTTLLGDTSTFRTNDATFATTEAEKIAPIPPTKSAYTVESMASGEMSP
eukprot:scaffold1307_cov200-Pinguiococcus_pyrenoidosus.AAC.75